MTITRKYYELLIELLTKICSIKQNEVKTFLDTKDELSIAIDGILKFNLFPLSFTEKFFNILHKQTIDSFIDEKLDLINELQYELQECLYTTRLRYGGELMHYLCEVNLAILNASVEELSEFEIIKKIPLHYSLEIDFHFSSEDAKIKEIRKIKSVQKKSEITKSKVRIKEKEFNKIEATLNQYFTKYKSYIFFNYPTILDLFTFYNKNVRAYVTEGISKDIYEFRVHSYESDSKRSSIKLIREYYDFYPVYSCNLEEISVGLIGSIIIGLRRRENLTFDNLFSLEMIHRELVNIFLNNSNEREVGEFAEFLLKCEGYKFIQTLNTQDAKFDLCALKSNKKYFFEIFHHKSRSISMIDEKIRNLTQINDDENIYFLFTTFPGESVINLLKKKNINNIILSDLINTQFSVDNSQILHWYIKSKLTDFNPTRNGSKTFEGENLKKRLVNCPTGNKNWSEYENIGAEIFKFLFEADFKSYMPELQSENGPKNHRRDLIVNNYYKDPTSFWAQVKQQYLSKAIIVEFKNYSEKLNSKTFFDVSKYTNRKVGNFAIVFSRKGLDKTAINEQKNLFDGNKLLIEFNDNDLIEMINEKMIGKDPLDRLVSKEFDIVKNTS